MKGWYKKNNSKTVVVFIHGLFSDSKKCWTADNGVFWPDLLQGDPRFDEPSVFLAEFYTSVGSNDYGVQECAKEVVQQLQREDEELSPPPIEKENIVFVTHSTGGIVVRYILEAFSDKFVGKRIGLCLYASPSFGSKISSFFGFFAKLFNNELAQELSWGSQILKDLDGRFRMLMYSKKLDICGMEMIENRSPFKMPFLKLRVVEKDSAARYFGNNKIIPGSDHSSIVKPEGIESDSHQALLDFVISEEFFVSRKKTGAKLKYPSLFDRYQLEYEDYFVERAEDLHLNKLLSQYSVWVYGRAGVGKTASITRAISRNEMHMQYISLGACIGSDISELFDVINSELTENLDSIGGSKAIVDNVRDIALAISEKCREKNYCLLIEEIPIQDELMFNEFSNYIYVVLNSLKNSNNFRLVLSSITRPNINVSPELEKISERMKMLEWERWSDIDIERLMSVIVKDVGISLVSEIYSSVFSGSPRSVKNRFRDELSKLRMQQHG